MLNAQTRTRVPFGKRTVAPNLAANSDERNYQLLQDLTINKRAAMRDGDLNMVRKINHQISRLEDLI